MRGRPAAAVSGALYVPVGALVLWHRRPTPDALACALAAGVFSSAVSYLADLLALRRVPAHFFGVFMSVNPVFAALVGLIVLDQALDTAAWAAILVIVGANAVAVTAASPSAKSAKSEKSPSGRDPVVPAVGRPGASRVPSAGVRRRASRRRRGRR